MSKFIDLCDFEIEALIAWHQNEQHVRASKEDYNDASWHKQRREELTAHYNREQDPQPAKRNKP